MTMEVLPARADIEGTLDGGFRFGIEMSGGLVEDDDVGGF